jgi:hypothetical protein
MMDKETQAAGLELQRTAETQAPRCCINTHPDIIEKTSDESSLP